MEWYRNIPQKCRHLNTWSPVSDTVLETLGDDALVEEVCYCGWALRVNNLTVLAVYSLCFSVFFEDLISQLLAPATMPDCHSASLKSWTLSWKQKPR